MSAAIALLSALSFGIADFLAGLMSRRAHFAFVGLLSQSAGLSLAITVALHDGRAPPAHDLGIGCLAGLGSSVGLLTLYRGLARGTMGVVGCVSAVGAAGLPVAYGFLQGERLSGVAVLGMLVAFPGVWLVSQDSQKSSWQLTGARDGLVAGIGFAVMFIALGSSGGDGTWWPVAASQAVSCTFMLAYVVASGATSEGMRSWTASRCCLLIGLLTSAGTLGFRWASSLGSLSISSLLASMYPGVTLLLATVLLHERLSTRQQVGLGVSAAAIVFITVGSW
jgi:drug/metabolite transporter (DMT)-like permease